MISIRKTFMTHVRSNLSLMHIFIDNDRYYSEAPYVFYRNGYYYFTWSKNDTRSADYEVRYVRSKSPVGPIDPSESRVVVCKKPDQGIYATGHQSFLQAVSYTHLGTRLPKVQVIQIFSAIVGPVPV